MSDGATKNTFDSLATGISTAERKDMLDKMNAASVENPAVENKSPPPQEKTSQLEFVHRFQKLNLLQKIVVWLQALFTGSTVENVMNKTMVQRIAQGVEQRQPTLIVYSRKVLYRGFYDRLLKLKEAVNYFRPYMQYFDKRAEDFYVLLAQLIMPEIEEQIEHDTDPYQFPFTQELSKEAHKSMQDAMLRTIGDIPQGKQEEMYVYVRALNWLNQLVKLSLDSLIARFSPTADGGQEALFGLVKSDFGSLAKVMCSYTLFDEKVANVIISFSEKELENSEIEVIDSGVMDSHVSTIKFFIDNVPMESLCKVVYNDALYAVGAVGGGENWFDKYVQKKKQLFEHKIKLWNADYKKMKLKGRLKKEFHLNEFPLFPSRPWEKVLQDEGMPFPLNLSLGLIYFFFQKWYDKYAKWFKAITMEGEFAAKENRFEFTASVESFTKMNNTLVLLSKQLAEEGDFAVEFARYYDTDPHTVGVRPKIRKILGLVENDVSEVLKEFGRCCYKMINLLTGFLSDKNMGSYCRLINIHRILNDECDFFAEIAYCRDNFQRIYEIFRDLELLESDVRTSS